MEYYKKYKNLFTKYCKIVEIYFPSYNKYLNNKNWLMWSFNQYVSKSGLKGLKGLLGFVQYSEDNNLHKNKKYGKSWIGGCLGHDINGIEDQYLSPRSSGYYKYYKK